MYKYNIYIYVYPSLTQAPAEEPWSPQHLWAASAGLTLASLLVHLRMKRFWVPLFQLHFTLASFLDPRLIYIDHHWSTVPICGGGSNIIEISGPKSQEPAEGSRRQQHLKEYLQPATSRGRHHVPHGSSKAWNPENPRIEHNTWGLSGVDLGPKIVLYPKSLDTPFPREGLLLSFQTAS